MADQSTDEEDVEGQEFEPEEEPATISRYSCLPYCLLPQIDYKK